MITVMPAAAASRTRTGIARSPRPGVKNTMADMREKTAPKIKIAGAPASSMGVSGARISITYAVPIRSGFRPESISS